MVQIAYAQSHTQPSGAWGRGDDGSWSPDNPPVRRLSRQVFKRSRRANYPLGSHRMPVQAQQEWVCGVGGSGLSVKFLIKWVTAFQEV